MTMWEYDQINLNELPRKRTHWMFSTMLVRKAGNW